MITKEIAMGLSYGTILYHVSIKGSDKLPIRCRVTGKCKTWKTMPERFRIPVRHGLRRNFAITEDNGYEWRKEEIDIHGTEMNPSSVENYIDRFHKP